MRSEHWRRGFSLTVISVLALTGCGGIFDGDDADDQQAALACDDGIRTSFTPDANTSVLLVQQFRQGEPVALSDTPASPAPPAAPVDVCLVKLVVGPGNPGTAGAPSTSPGIGIEVWLPAPTAWNEIVRNYGSGGFAGGFQADPTRLGNSGGVNPVHLAAVGKGYVVATSDHGHGNPGNGSFLLNEDGSINTVLWQDFAERSLQEMAVKSKALTRTYYGRPHRYAYFDGFSTGGRQGYKLAQRFPDEFDGILAGAPAFNWTRFITAELYPQVVMQQDLGYVIPEAKLHAVSAAANAACGGADLGFQIDPLQCGYDPTRDAAALCAGQAGSGGVVGTSSDADTCLTGEEALAVNKIWYGQTADGSVLDPAVDNGSSTTLAGNHLWWGLTRGTLLTRLAGTPPFPIASVMVALELQNPAIAQSTPPGTLTDASGANLGQDGWANLTYMDLANAQQQGVALQSSFADINTDDPDLSGARDSGVKVLSYHGLNDELIMPQGSINYFERVAATMGGRDAVQQFNRLYLIPGMAHDSTFSRSASIDPATCVDAGGCTAASADKVPMPENVTGRDELFMALRNWVERGEAPGRIDVSSDDGSVSMPICPYPQKAVHDGSGPVTAASSYDCR